MNADYLIECRNLIANVSKPQFISKGLDLDIESGQIIILTGPENMGKNDWLKTIGGVFYPVGGTISFFGRNAKSFSQDERSLLRKDLAYITGELNLLSVINGLVNVMLPATYHKMGSSEQIKTKAQNLIIELGIDDELDQLPASMHKDQRYLLMVARALMLDPRVLFLEKPFFQLDTVSAEHFKHFLNDLAKQKNLTIMISTQDINFIRQYADKVLFITLDEIFSFASADEFFNCDKTQIANFLGDTTTS